jgi:hypothetical protein
VVCRGRDDAGGEDGVGELEERVGAAIKSPSVSTVRNLSSGCFLHLRGYVSVLT